jgi:uncharacterized repeat protein (TIGR01451 family)
MVALAAAVPTAAHAEGSVDINLGPDSATRHALYAFGPGAYSMRVYARAGETIQAATSHMGMGAANIRVYRAAADPTADPTAGPVLYDCNAEDPGTGLIASRAEELAGPAPNAGGYAPCDFVAPADGIYAIRMDPRTQMGNPDPGTVAAPLTGITQGPNLTMWDITVRDGGAVQPGRVFSYDAGYRTTFRPLAASNFASYVYTNTGYEYRVNFFDHAGGNWNLTANDKGLVDRDTGERVFASFVCAEPGDPGSCTYDDAVTPPVSENFPSFVNRVDPVVISGAGGLQELSGFSATPITPGSQPLQGASFTGEDGAAGTTSQGDGGTLAFSSHPTMAGLGYTVAIDFDRDGTFAGSEDVVDTAAGDLAASGTNSYAWNGRTASGATPACGTYPYRVSSALSEVHFTQADPEDSGGMQIERLTLPADPTLGDPLAASYDDRDPYKSGRAVTNTAPGVVQDGTSGPGFHAWTDSSGDRDYVDTWARSPEVETTGTLEVLCADLGIAKSGPATVDPSGRITWTLNVTNNGPGASAGSTVTDTIPAGVTDVSSDTPGCTVADGKVTCAVGALAVGASTSITVRGTAPATRNTCVVNSATVDGDGDDPNAANDTATATTCTPPPPLPRYDLQMTKTAADTTVRVGDTVVYTLEAKNLGPDAAAGVKVTDKVPDHLDVRSASTRQGTCTVTGNAIACDVGTLAPGQTVKVTVRATALRVGSPTNTGVVVPPPPPPSTPPGTPPVDPPANNTDTAIVKIGKAAIGLTKTANRKTVRAGQRITYTLRVSNPSKETLRNVRVCDDLPSGLVYVSSKAKAKRTKGQYCWTVKSLAAGKSRSFTMTVRALRGASGRKVNRAVATASNAATKRAKRTVTIRRPGLRAGGVTG